MSSKLVVFHCPEGHLIEVRPEDIKDNKQVCDKCGNEYRFKTVELEAADER